MQNTDNALVAMPTVRFFENINHYVLGPPVGSGNKFVLPAVTLRDNAKLSRLHILGVLIHPYSFHLPWLRSLLASICATNALRRVILDYKIADIDSMTISRLHEWGAIDEELARFDLDAVEITGGGHLSTSYVAPQIRSFMPISDNRGILTCS